MAKMILKTYRAASMADALALVKKDLGKDAVILSTRSLRVGGFLGFGGKTVVEITASDQAPMFARGGAGGGGGGGAGSRRAGAGAAGGMRLDNGGSGAPAGVNAAALNAYAANARLAGAEPSGTGLAGAGSAGGGASGALARGQADAGGEGSAGAARFVPAPEVKPDPLEGVWPRSAGESAAAARLGASGAAGGGAGGGAGSGGDRPRVMPVRSARLAMTSAFAPTDALANQQIRKELSDIKLLVNQVLQSGAGSIGGAGSMGGAAVSGGGGGRGGTCGAMSEALFNHYLKLLEAQVAREVADSIVGAVRDELTAGELADESIVRASVLRHLSRLLPVDERAMRLPGGMETGERGSGEFNSSGRRPFVVALVGPTGVGKTTTIAKLAAAYKLRHGRSVALITSDTYRIAAVDQLRTYASIIGLNLRVVLTPDEMRTAVRELSGHEVILIDTAGRSQHNTDRIEELCAFLAAAAPDQTHLVLSSASSEAVMLKTAEAFAPALPDHILFTKLDEAVNFGVLVNVVRRVSVELGLRAQDGGEVSLSFVTTGQEVPDHIEAGRSDRLARVILDNRFPGEDRSDEGPRAEVRDLVGGGAA